MMDKENNLSYHFLKHGCVLRPDGWDFKFWDVVGHYNSLWFGKLFTSYKYHPYRPSVERMMKMLDVFGIMMTHDQCDEYLCVRMRTNDEIAKIFPYETKPYTDVNKLICDDEFYRKVKLFELKDIETLQHIYISPLPHITYYHNDDVDSDPSLKIKRSISNEFFTEIVNLQKLGEVHPKWKFIDLHHLTSSSSSLS